MKKISAIVIAKDEEEMIADCLESLSFAGEIIVVDNDSADRTKEIAERLGAKVFSIKSSDFSEIRNLGLEKASGEWILYVDADERISPALAEEIQFKIQNSKFKIYKLKRKNFYLGNNEWPYVERLERLFKKEKLKGWKGKLHESPIFDGETGELGGFLLHYTHRSLSQMLNKTIEWSKIEAELRLNSSHPYVYWWRFPRVMISSFASSYFLQKGWKAGTAGLIESLYQAYSSFITYVRLWELQQRK